MDKKRWAIIGLVLNLIALVLTFLIQEEIIILMLLILGIILSIILFFKESKWLIFLVIAIPLFILFIQIRAIFAGGTSSVTDINDSVRQDIENLFNNS